MLQVTFTKHKNVQNFNKIIYTKIKRYNLVKITEQLFALVLEDKLMPSRLSERLHSLLIRYLGPTTTVSVLSEFKRRTLGFLQIFVS